MRKAEPQDERALQWELRPRHLQEYVNQKAVVENLRIALVAATQRGDALEHVLLHGPPGLGKTTLAHIIAEELGAAIVRTSGPTLERPKDLVGILSNLQRGDVLFVDEIHRLPRPVEEYLYSAMEDFKIDIITGEGVMAKAMTFRLEPFTLVGATTRAGFLTAPLRERFGLFYHLDFYPEDELVHVIERSAALLSVPVEDGGVIEVARRSSGTPRTANRLLRRVRDFAQVKADGRITSEVAEAALGQEGIDRLGLNALDRQYLQTIAENYRGGPVGIEALAATLNEEPDTLVDLVEPYLLKIGFLLRTPAGRRTAPPANAYLGLPSTGLGPDPDTEQPRLL
jgi:Holliday junction DNA helicase RuvB